MSDPFITINGERIGVADVPLHPHPAEASFCVRHGDVFAIACALLAAVAIAVATRRRAPVRTGAG